MVAASDSPELFKTVKLKIFPSPLSASPILVLSFVQEYSVLPSTFVVEKLIGEVIWPLHKS